MAKWFYGVTDQIFDLIKWVFVTLAVDLLKETLDGLDSVFYLSHVHAGVREELTYEGFDSRGESVIGQLE